MRGNPTPEQAFRLSGPINFGHILQPANLPPRSSIISQPQFEENELDFYVSINSTKQLKVKMSNKNTVGQLVEHLRESLAEEGNPFMFFGEEAMNYNDILADWGIINESIVRVNSKNIHSLTITILLPDVKEKVMAFCANQTIKGIQIKKVLQKQGELDCSFMKLVHSGIELKDQSSLADLGIYGNCTLILKYCQPKGIKNDCTVRLRDFSLPKIKEIINSNQVLSYDPVHKNKQTVKVEATQSHSIKSFNRLTLADKTEIISSEGTYFYTEEQRWVSLSDSEKEKDRLSLKSKVMKADGKFVAVENIHLNLVDLKHQTDLTYLLLSNHMPYFANQVLITPPLDIQVLIREQDSFQLLILSLHPFMTVSDLKTRIERKLIERKLQRDPKEQHLYIEKHHLILKDSIRITDIYEPNLIIQLSYGQDKLKSFIETEKMVEITFESNTKRVKYASVAELTCEEVIIRQFREKAEEFPYFGVLYGSKVINPETKFKDIKSEGENFYYSTFQITAFKFPQRFKLAQIIKQFRPSIKNQGGNFFSKIASFFTLKSNEPPMLVNYKSNFMLKEISEVLNNLHKLNLSDRKHHAKFQYISELINFITKNDQYTKVCYRALSEDRLRINFRENSIINIRDFFFCSTKKELAESLLSRNDVLLHIQSISGRLINLKNDTEIAFLPFSYFIVQKVFRSGQILHVVLSEMPAPLFSTERMILWVDDVPEGNLPLIVKYRNKNTEIIQISSTDMARRWFKEFGWVINRLNIQLRVITDMVRIEPNSEGKQNYEAGIDLIEYLFTHRGFTTPVLVFCLDFKRGLENLEKRKVRSDRFHQVTNQFEKLGKYMAFESSVHPLPSHP